MSILDALRQQSSSIDDLAALPQAMIMQMAQRKQISEEMLAPILARKAELADAFARQNALQNAGQMPPTVIEQLMSQNAQAEQPQMPQQVEMPQQMPQDMGVAQLPIPERQYAGGGIIAFEEGGDVEDEDFAYQMALEDQDMNMGSSIEDIYNMARYGSREMPSGSSGTGITTGYRGAEKGISTFASPNRGTEEDITSLRRETEQGVEPSESGLARLRAQIMERESGGRRYDKDGNLLTSSKGALGEMQVMPDTARDPGFGIRPARNNSPDELRRVGDEYAAVLLGRYRDPKLAMIAYNMGPGATDRWLASGADPRRLPKETQGYIRGVNLAQGGEVQHFQAGGLGGEFGDTDQSYEMDALRLEEIDRARRLQEAQEKNEFLRQSAPQLVDKSVPERAAPTPVVKEEKAKPVVKKDEPDLQSRFDDFVKQQQANPDRNIFAEMIARNEAQRVENKKSAAEDRNLALLAAGLGMLGGTSPYAAVNIGQGGAKGVEFLGASKARRASELNALSNADLKAMYYGEENRRKERALSEGLYDRRLAAVREFEENTAKKYFIPGITPTAKQIEAYEKKLREDPTYARLMQNSGMPVATQTAPVLNYNLKTRTLGQ